MDDGDRIAYLAGDPGDPGAPLSAAARAELDDLRGVLADPSVWVEPDPALRERVVSAIGDAAEPARSAAGSTPVVAAAAHRNLRSRWIPVAILGVAAAAVLAIGPAVDRTGREHRSAEYTAALRGTALAPDARGTATFTETASGWEIHLQASGLPRRADGGFYEAWLKDGAGALVPVGTFNQADDVVLWAGVAPSRYPTVTVTRQLANGDQASTGQVVVAGSIHRE